MNRPAPAQKQKPFATGMTVLAWLTLLGLGVMFFSELLERQRNPNQSPDTRLGERGAKEVVLQRNKFGHYVTTGTINGQSVTFLVDTGATGVALPEGIARRLGLQRGRPYQAQTANGITTSYAVKLAEVGVGDIRIRNVEAGIAPGMGINQVLLGMSFLKHIEFTQRGDKLILRQY